MGLGREVADAYISVHGDLSPFRRDLSKANKDIEKAAKNDADKYADAWGKRLERQTKDRWNAIVDTMYGQKKIDVNRLIEHFDPTDLDHAKEEINKFLLDMSRNQHLIGQDYKDTKKALNDAIDGMKERNKLEAEHQQMLLGNSMAQDANNKLFAEANKENERWARTMDGMRKNNAIANMEGDFKRLAQVMTTADMGKFAKSFDSLTHAKNRVQQVTDAMQQQGRMSDEQARMMHAHMDEFMRDETAKSKAMKDALDETNRLRKAQDDYNNSLRGMSRNNHFAELENDFRSLARAMDNNDWSHFARGAKDIDQMRQKIKDTAFLMHGLGRMTDSQLSLVRDRAGEVTHAFSQAERGTNLFAAAGERLRGTFARIGPMLNGTREHLQGFAGLNVFGDMIREGLDFIHNLDRIAVSASNTALKLGSIASIGGSALGSLTVILQDLGQSLSGFSALLPAFATGFGFMAYVGMTALQGMASKYKKELKAWKEDMFAELNKGLQPAMDRFSNVMLPTLQKNLKGVAAAEGRLFGAILDGITKSTGPKDMDLMFKRMNDAMDKSHIGVKAFIDAWARLGLVGSKYFGRFADWINKLGTSFDKFITKAQKSGQIDKWIEKGIKGFKDLGRTIDGTMGIFNAIADAARKAGSGGLSSFADKLQNIAKAMQEAGFQKTLVTMFEGMRGATEKVGIAIGNLGPAVASVMPSIKTALLNIGDVASGVIGYIGQILSSPAVQTGIENFTNGMKTAMEHLAPAIKPFSDSLGNAMTLLGNVLVSVADIATAFTVVLGPVLDDMSRKIQTLLKPLSDMAVNAVKALKPVADAVDTYIVGPLADAMKNNIIPSVNDFLGKAGPFMAKVVTDLGPAFKDLVNNALPKAVQFAGELLDPLGKVFGLFTPLLATTITNVGNAFGSLASAMRIAKGEARAEDWNNLFGGLDPAKIQKQADAAGKQVVDSLNGRGTSKSWGQILSDAFWGVPPDVLWSEVYGKIGPNEKNAAKWDATVGKWLEGARSGIADVFRGSREHGGIDEQVNNWFRDNVMKPWQTGVDSIGKGRWGATDQGAQNWDNTVGKFLEGARSGIADVFRGSREKGGLDETVNKWFDEHFFKPIKKGWDDMWKGLGDWWKDRKKDFQDFMSGLLGFDTHPGKDAKITGSGMGGGAGGKGSGVSGTMDPAMFGLPTTEGVNSYFTQLGTDIRTGLTNALNGVGEVFGISDMAGKWDAFWADPVGSTQRAWEQIGMWVSQGYTNISTGITTWFDGLGPQWDGFWTGIGDTISRVWTGITTWVSTQVTNISTGIQTWIAGLGPAWNGFWGGIGDTVNRIWTNITTWISTQVNNIRNGINGFVSGVSAQWNGFWGGVGDTVNRVWGQITSWIAGQVGNIRGNINGFISGVTGAWNSFWGGLPGFVQRAWSNITTGVTTGINTVVGWVQGLPGKISGALSGLGNLLLDAGGSIMGGLQRGLEGAWKGVQDFVGGVAQWIADHKGPISYDRTLLVPAGEAIMGGFNASLQNKFGDVMDFISSIADTMAGVFAHSKMFVMGADAALGLASGFASGKTSIAAAVGSLTPDVSLAANLSGAYGSGVGGPTPTKIVNVAAGAITVTTPTKSPELVASKTIDALVSGSNF